MLYIILLLIVAGFSLIFFYVYKLWKEVLLYKSTLQVLQQLIVSVNKIHSRIDKIFTIDVPSPNDAIKIDTNEVDLSTTDMQVPKDVKLDLEGGDSNTPPGFEEKK